MKTQPSWHATDSYTAPSCYRHFFPCSSLAPWKNFHQFSRCWDQLYGPCLLVCLFVGIKPEKLYSASCVGREVNPLEWSHTGRGTNHVRTKDSGKDHALVTWGAWRQRALARRRRAPTGLDQSNVILKERIFWKRGVHRVCTGLCYALPSR